METPSATGRGEGGGPAPPAHPPTEIRDDETVVARCPHCDRPFAAERPRDLHVGEVHGDVASATERDAYEEALAAERDDLFYFHLRVVAALAVLYSALVLVYMVALGSGFL